MIPPVSTRPAIDGAAIRRALVERYALGGELHELPSERDQNFRLDADDGASYVVKIASGADDLEVLEAQCSVLDHLAATWSRGASPHLVRALDGEAIVGVEDADGEVYRLRLLTFLEGQPMSRVGWMDTGSCERLGEALAELDERLDECRAAVDGVGALERELFWDLATASWISAETAAIADPDRRRLVEQLLLQYRGRVLPVLEDLPVGLIHNDANDENVLLEPDFDGGWGLAGLVDFGDMVISPRGGEIAVAAAYASLHAGDPVATTAAVAAGYDRVAADRGRPLTDGELEVAFPLVCTRLCLSVTVAAINERRDPGNEHVQISRDQAWEMLAKLAAVDWRRAEHRVRQACGREPRVYPAVGRSPRSYYQLLAHRLRVIGPSLSLSYAEPLAIVGGRGQYLYDPAGKAHLDCVNNVCHVGHCHPRVVAALAEQAATLNTNTRYLHPHLVEYAERLTSTLPEPLSVCFFVNSGSEANELAVRIARAHTRRRDAIVIDGAYHGNTATLVDLSPYKAEGPGGRGLPEWVHKVAVPDGYRGAHRGRDEAIGAAYAGQVAELCERLAAAGHPPGFFLCEPILGCGGQLLPPPGYFEAAFRHVRAAGGLCIADEVQVGFGRVGRHTWAFELHGVVPDVVTLGKPMGNGHPIGAVVTTPEIAVSFANGMEFFSTFGGNPVSCAVGLAVLDVIADEGLQARAARLGDYLTAGFRRLADRHRLVGDVRGAGLFLGVELVLDRETLEPASEETGRVVELAKADGVLLSAEGPHHNVLKIKPPLVFAEPDADLLLSAVDRALATVG